MPSLTKRVDEKLRRIDGRSILGQFHDLAKEKSFECRVDFSRDVPYQQLVQHSKEWLLFSTFNVARISCNYTVTEDTLFDLSGARLSCSAYAVSLHPLQKAKAGRQSDQDRVKSLSHITFIIACQDTEGSVALRSQLLGHQPPTPQVQSQGTRSDVLAVWVESQIRSSASL